MAKKKKTQLKPVARGFATTSYPKKVVPVQDEELFVANAADPPNSAPAGAPGESDISGAHGVEPDAEPDQETVPRVGELDLERIEERSLQSLVDKLQDRTEKDIKRAVRGVQQERRHALTLPPLDLDATLVNQILTLVSESKAQLSTEEKAVARIGLTYGVLRRLGFSEERVMECLGSIHGVDLDEAYDWLYLHCSDEELSITRGPDSDGLGPKPPPTPRTPDTPFSSEGPLTPSASSSFTVPPVPALGPISKPKPRTAASLVDSNRLLLDDGSRTPSEYGTPEEDPNLVYARLRVKLDSVLPGHGKTAGPLDDLLVQQLRGRLEDVKSHYFFNQKDAEAQYRLERQRAQAQSLQARLRANECSQDSASSTATSASPPAPSPLSFTPPRTPVRQTDGKDIFDEDEDGGFFELFEEVSASAVSETGKTIRVRSMPIPKSSATRLPKKFFAEAVAKTDSFASITYRDISGSSRAKRAAVAVRWSRGKVDEWSMDDIACHDVVEAEQYISTIALYALTYPASEGFAGGGSPTSTQTFFRLLPPAFRELWDELEEQRRTAEDAINRAVWAKLRAVVETKLSIESKVRNLGDRTNADSKGAETWRGTAPVRQVDPRLAEAFQARQATSAYQEMLAQRLRLPIANYRQTIVGILETSQVMVLSGETGCGKSTQLPAYILEDHLARGLPVKIYCTEPRRISALSLAQRVSRELGDVPGVVGTANSLVGYSIRLESKISRNTMLAYVTNGIALRMFESGGDGEGGFDEVTHVIVDEVHERGIESDFLLLGLKTLLLQRPDLKVVLMSATLDAQKISAYFGNCPVLHVPGRTFPVDVKFLEDAIEFTEWSIDEGSPYARRGNDKFYKGRSRQDWSEDIVGGEEDEDENQSNVPSLEKRYSSRTKSTISLLDERLIPYDLIVRLLEHVCFRDVAYHQMSSAILIFLPGLGEIRRLHDILTEHPRIGSDEFVIHPLHSTTSSENQGAVFDIPPAGVRKIVIATNIAETGITIPDITCVIDSGKHREMRFDEKRQLSRLVETFVAKSNAAQRRGRAGRVQNGLCFHLFTKFRHDSRMAEHPEPEILRLSLSDLALRTKTMKARSADHANLGSTVEEVLSQALDPPSSANIQRAVSVLVEVRALTPKEEITTLGRLLMRLSLDVHLGKFLIMACLFQCLDPALSIAATLSSKSPFITPFGHEQQADLAKSSFRVENSDFLTLHKAYSSWRTACGNKPSFVRDYCRKNYLSHQNLLQIKELREQFLSYLIDSGLVRVGHAFIKELNRTRYSRSRVPKFVSIPPQYDIHSLNFPLVNAALAAGLYPKILHINPSTSHVTTISNSQTVAFHPSSVNFKRRPSDFGVNHLVYFTLMHSKKLYAWETGPADDAAIILLCGESDFKLISDSAFVDRRVRFHVCSPKVNVALKHLHIQLASLVSAQLRTAPLTETQVRWRELAVTILGKMRIMDPDEAKIVIR
ncbi:P-loop containing nucleoside triphosphate hydrolase protein [Vararia minispora EC-137]|uniref:P-loop containing nucleoside triphosphate hydrolase protein n=1 Tax=Vararia minispora EC-137 TaxID=1314806 RepID=A0ACB8QQY9_9AGAM|nr:P-loop containing nucleoside triphosphate hydrolase protein [Vararia minispora EC-137]